MKGWFPLVDEEANVKSSNLENWGNLNENAKVTNETYLRVWVAVAESVEALELSGLWRGSGEETALACSVNRKTGLVLPFSIQSQVFEKPRQLGSLIFGFNPTFCPFLLDSFRKSELFFSWLLNEERGTFWAPGTLNISFSSFLFIALLITKIPFFIDSDFSVGCLVFASDFAIFVVIFKCLDILRSSRFFEERGLDEGQNWLGESIRAREEDMGDMGSLGDSTLLAP